MINLEQIEKYLNEAQKLIDSAKIVIKDRDGLQKSLDIEKAKPDIKKNMPPLADEKFYSEEIFKCNERLFDIQKEFYSIIQKIV